MSAVIKSAFKTFLSHLLISMQQLLWDKIYLLIRYDCYESFSK